MSEEEKGRTKEERLSILAVKQMDVTAAKSIVGPVLWLTSKLRQELPTPTRTCDTYLSNTCVLITVCRSATHRYSYSAVVCTAFVRSHTEIHTEKPAFQGICYSVRQRSSVTDPSVQNKDLSSAVILPSTDQGILHGACWTWFEVVIYLFHLLSRAWKA